jgi:hypothetical protein
LQIHVQGTDELLCHDLSTILEDDVQPGVHGQRVVPTRRWNARHPAIERFERSDEQPADDAATVILKDNPAQTCDNAGSHSVFGSVPPQ